MSETYYASNTTSDLSAGGVFDYSLLPDAGTANTTQVSVAKLTTVSADLFTEAGNPSDQGSATGSWSFELNVLVGDTAVAANVYLYRVNSGGSVQSGPIESAELGQTLSAGVKTYTWSSPALGTFATGDRVRVGISFVNGTHGNATLDLGFNTADSEFIAPYTLAGPAPYSFAVWA